MDKTFKIIRFLPNTDKHRMLFSKKACDLYKERTNIDITNIHENSYEDYKLKIEELRTDPVFIQIVEELGPDTESTVKGSILFIDSILEKYRNYFYITCESGTEEVDINYLDYCDELEKKCDKLEKYNERIKKEIDELKKKFGIN